MLWSPEFGWTTQQPLLPFSLIHCITTALTVRELGWADQNGTNTTIGKDSHVNNSARPVHCDVFKLNVHTSMANSPNILAQIWTYSLQNINSLIFLLKEKWWDRSFRTIYQIQQKAARTWITACLCVFKVNAAQSSCNNPLQNHSEPLRAFWKTPTQTGSVQVTCTN